MLNETSAAPGSPTPPPPAAAPTVSQMSIADFDAMMAQAAAASREAAEDDRLARARERRAKLATVISLIVLAIAGLAFKLGRRDALRDDRAKAKGWDSYEQYKAAKDAHDGVTPTHYDEKTERDVADGYERWKAEQGR